MRTHKFIDEIEKDHFEILKSSIETHKNVEEKDIKNIISTLFLKRQRFGQLFSFYQNIRFYVLSNFRCCVSKNSRERKQYKIYTNGNRKFFKELDVISLLRNVRLQKVLANTQLTPRQNILLQF
jgi:hypothetical protein